MKPLSSHCLILLVVMGLILILIFLTSEASASTITVPDDYPTIQEAVNNSGDGDTIFVKAGIYYENVMINRTTFVEEPARLTLEGEDQKTEIIGDDGTCIAVSGDYYVTITGFKLREGIIGIHYLYSSGGLISKNTIRNMEASGINLDHTGNLSIRECNIEYAKDGLYALTYWKDYPVIIEDTHISNTAGLGSHWYYSYLIVRNTTFTETVTHIDGNSEVFFKDSYFIEDSALMIDALYGGRCHVRAVNTVFYNGSGPHVKQGGTLIIQNYLEVSSINAVGTPISGVDVNIEDNGNITFATSYFGGTDAKTDTEGRTDWILITDRIYNDSNSPIENITKLEVHHPEIMFQDNPRYVDMEESHSEIFQRSNEPPTAHITSPMESQNFFEGDSIAFSGYATDPEEGTLSGNSLAWESDLDGIIGLGTGFDLATLSLGNHTITLMAVDGLGANATAVVNITIEVYNPPVDDNDGILDIDEPSDGDSTHILYLILVGALIIAVIILLIRTRRKNVKAQSQPAQVSPALYPAIQPQLIRCPSCSHRFEVADRQRPLMIHCPNCGMEGSLDT